MRLLHRLAALWLLLLIALLRLLLRRLLLLIALLLIALRRLLLIALLRLLHWLTLRRLLLIAALLLHRLAALWLLLLIALLRLALLLHMLAALWHTAATVTEYRPGIEAAAELLARCVCAGVDPHAVKAGRDPLRLVVVVPAMHDHANRLALVNQLAVLHRVGEHLARFVVNVRHAVR